MNCDDLHRHLDAYLAGHLVADLAAALDAHLQTCAECRSVVAGLSAADPACASFVLDVVARTTGSNCSKVREALAAALDEAGAPDTELRAHLSECGACAAIADALTWNAARLPRLAALEVDADFTADVLMATLPRPSLARVFALRLRERIDRWLERPLVAQELAFALTVVLVLLTATPWSPWPGLPQRALDLLQIVPEVQAGEPGAEHEDWSLVQALPPLRYASEAGDGIREAVTPRVERVSRDLEWVGAGLGETGQGVVAIEPATMRNGLRTLGCGLSSLWEGLRVPQAPVQPDCAPTRPSGRDVDTKDVGGEE